jgi:hypothetical protein
MTHFYFHPYVVDPILLSWLSLSPAVLQGQTAISSLVEDSRYDQIIKQTGIRVEH